MKTYRILSIALALGLLVSCGDRLNVTNPNKFTVEDINENILQSGDESKIKLALEGMANTMPTQMMVYDAALTKGYGNRWSADATHQLAHDMLIGDIVSGPDAAHAGVLQNWYSVESSFPYYRYNAETTGNYANYISACIKIANAIKVMQNISEESIEKSKGETQKMLKDYRARCLVVYALGYMQLMEIYIHAFVLYFVPDGEYRLGAALNLKFQAVLFKAFLHGRDEIVDIAVALLLRGVELLGDFVVGVAVGVFQPHILKLRLNTVDAETVGELRVQIASFQRHATHEFLVGVVVNHPHQAQPVENHYQHHSDIFGKGD